MARPRHRAWRLALAVAVLAVTPAAVAQDARVLNVTRTDDPAPDGCRPDDCSLREAVAAANAQPGQDVVALPVGVFPLERVDRTPTTGSINRLSAAARLSHDGSGQALYVTGELVIQGVGPEESVIDLSELSGREEGAWGPGVWAEDAELTLENLTMRNAQRYVNPAGSVYGVESALTLRSVAITGDLSGRAIAVDNRADGQPLLVEDSLFQGNAAGAVDYYGGERVSGPPAVQVRRSLFSDNGARGRYFGGQAVLNLSVAGGHPEEEVDAPQAVIEDSRFLRNGIPFRAVGSVRVSRSSFVGNSSDVGGAMDFRGLQPVLLEEVLVESNTATLSGGGVSARDLVVRDSVFRHNQADLDGGAIHVHNRGAQSAMQVSGSAFVGNDAGRGGAIHFENGDARLSNVTLSGNVAREERREGGNTPGGKGAALYVGEHSTVSVVHGTVVGNRGDLGALYAPGFRLLEVANSVVADTLSLGGARAPNCAGVEGGGTLYWPGFNVVDDDSCGFSDQSDRVTEPGLGPLVSTGGTWAHLPLAGSPLVDGAGTFHLIDSPEPEGCPGVDQRGLARPVDGDGDGSVLCDIGAVEALSGRVGRVAGADRVATAVAVSRAGHGEQDAGAVVLARADGFADGLAGGPLAAAEDGPLLLTGRDGLDVQVEAELARVLPQDGEVVLLGGEAALRAPVEDRVAELGYRPVRVAGLDRYATAVAVARRIGDPELVLLASGVDFPDALSAGAAAASRGAAVLLTAGGQLPPPTRAYLDERPDADRVAVGGPAATADPRAEPVVGRDRYATAVAVARRFHDRPAWVGVASGTSFPDALAAAADTVRRGGPLLLSSPDGLPSSVAAYLADVAPTLAVDGEPVRVYGGEKALSLQVEADLDSALRP